MTLKEEVYEDLENYDSEEERISYLKDVLQYGCQSGMVSKLIYYSDTIKFYDRNEEEIEDLIEELRDLLGYKNRLEFISSLNGAENISNMTTEKNLLSWFSYEETCKKILEEEFREEY